MWTLLIFIKRLNLFHTFVIFHIWRLKSISRILNKFFHYIDFILLISSINFRQRFISCQSFLRQLFSLRIVVIFMINLILIFYGVGISGLLDALMISVQFWTILFWVFISVIILLYHLFSLTLLPKFPMVFYIK